MRIIAFCALFISTQAIGQDTLYPDYNSKGKPTLLHGQGGRSCGSFIKDSGEFKKQTGAHAQDMAWPLGFLAAIDQWNPYTVKNYDYNGLEVWLDSYCKSHPIELLVNAADHFYQSIGGRYPVTQDVTIWKQLSDYRRRP